MSSISLKLNYASARSAEEAACEIFGADTQGAGFSQSVRGSLQITGGLEHQFAGDSVRGADNESPSLTFDALDGNRLFDAGNLDLSHLDPEMQVEKVATKFTDIIASGRVPICLGGDHLIKFSAFKALAQAAPDCAFLYVDAHPDSLPSERVNYSSILHHAVHGVGVKSSRIVLLGLRQMTVDESNGLRSLGIKAITAHSFNCRGPQLASTELKNSLGKCRKLYVSIDLDAFHSSEAPAVEAAYPGGIFFSPVVELLRLLSVDFELAGMDVSEFLPRFDEARHTALLAAALAKEFYSLASQQRSSATA